MLWLMEEVFFYQPFKSNARTCGNIKKKLSMVKEGDNYATSCLFGLHYFKENYKLVNIN